jgi:HK97 family phage portal protein
MYIIPNQARQPHSLKRLAPWTVAIQAAQNGRVIGYVQFDENDPTNQTYVSYEPHEIMHFRIDDPDNDLYGLSPLASLEGSVAQDLLAQNYNASFFQNSGITGTIISVKGVDKEEIQRNRQFLMDNYTGPDAAHKPVFLEGEAVTVTKSVVSHTDMGFLEGRKFIILEILAVLDVPPAKVGIMESANRSNSKEQDKSFRSEAVSPLQYIVESVINGQFIKPILGVDNTIFVHSEGDTRDAVELMNYYTKGIAWGIFNANEVRAKMGMAPVEGGEINGIMAPTGFVPLDRLNLYFKIPKLNTDMVPEVPQDPVAGEATPKNTPTTEVASGQSREVAKALQTKYDAARDGMYILLQPDALEPKEIVKAYSYFKDAEGADPAFDLIGDLLKKAKSTDEEDLRIGYLERVKDTFNEWCVRREEEL